MDAPTPSETIEEDAQILLRGTIELCNPALSPKREAWVTNAMERHVRAMIARHGEPLADKICRRVRDRLDAELRALHPNA